MENIPNKIISTNSYNPKGSSSIVSRGIQANHEDADQTGERLRKQAIILKYAKIWMKNCVEGNSVH